MGYSLVGGIHKSDNLPFDDPAQISAQIVFEFTYVASEFK